MRIAIQVSVAVSSPTGTTRELLVPGKIVELSLDTLRKVDPCPKHSGCNWSGNLGVSAVFAAWNSGAYASDVGDLGAMVYHGGGDGDYWGNETYLWELDTRKWRRINEPSITTGAGKQVYNRGECTNQDGRPGAPHSYDAYEYLSAAEGGGRQGSLFIAKLTFVQTTNTSTRSWATDLSTGEDYQWTSNKATLDGDHIPIICKDTLRRRFWMHYSNNTNVRLQSQTWAKRTWDTDLRYPSLLDYAPFGYAAVGEYYPPKDLFVIHCRDRHTATMKMLAIRLSDPAQRRWLSLDGTIPGNGNSNGMCYAPSVGPKGTFFIRCGIKGYEQHIWAVTPPAGDDWTESWHIEDRVVGGAVVSPESNSADFHGIWKRMRWASKVGAVLWCSGATLPVYGYKP